MRRSIGCVLVLVLLFARVTSAKAGILQAYSGNSDAESTSGFLTCIANCAVYDRLSGGTSAGDAYGTGYSGFDALALEDTTARFLYLYDQTSVSGGYSSFGIWPIYGITSTVQVALAFADNNGAVSTTNAFGSDTLFYRPSAPATVGVTSPHLLSKSNLVSGSLSLSGTTLYDSLSLPSGATTELYGFTSDNPPAMTTEISSISTVGFTCPSTSLSPVPEPGSLCLGMAGLAISTLLRVRRTRTTVKSHEKWDIAAVHAARTLDRLRVEHFS